jgi:hypothetical protein
MKIRLNKQTLSEMSPEVRAIVLAWKTKTRKTTISVETRPNFFIEEDARYTVINLATQESKSARAAGEWAGITGLLPGAECPLPVGVVVIETGYFLGVPFLNIYQGGPKQIPTYSVPHNGGTRLVTIPE